MKTLDVKYRHQSMRGWFAYELYKQMAKNDRVWLVAGDLGYKMLDHIKKDFSKRFINCGTAEQSMMGISVGLALSGKIPFVYSITTFLLYRPFETIRNYVNHEKIPVKLIASGRNKDYAHDGISHWAQEDKSVMSILKNIESRWPETLGEIPEIVERMVNDKKPWYLNLRRE